MQSAARGANARLQRAECDLENVAAAADRHALHSGRDSVCGVPAWHVYVHERYRHGYHSAAAVWRVELRNLGSLEHTVDGLSR